MLVSQKGSNGDRKLHFWAGQKFYSLSLHKIHLWVKMYFELILLPSKERAPRD